MELLMPGLGLIFWMTIAFGFVLLILKKYAWGPILNVLQERENKLAQSFSDAQRIEQEMSELAKLKSQKIAEAEEQHKEIVTKAQLEAERIIEAARTTAREEARVITEKADELVESYKQQAMREVKSQLSALSLEIAEKVLKEEFSDKKRNEQYVNKLLDEVVMN
jgi:F-type H+-transporting ATPase subunit b